METTSQRKRRERIREQLREIKGFSATARRARVSRRWVHYVLDGEGVSERVLRTAEALIAERKQKQEIN